MMGIRFTTLRGFVLGLICLLCIASVSLIWGLFSFLTNKSSLIVITAVPVLTVFGISASLLSRPILRKLQVDVMFKQTIMWEVVWSIGLVPFNIVLCSITLVMRPSGNIPYYARQLFSAMKAVFMANTALVTTYALVVYALAIAIHYTVDNEVWTRDVYGDPGPFPIRDFITYCRGRRGADGVGRDAAVRRGVQSPNAGRTAHFCTPGSCCCEAEKPQVPLRSIQDTVSAGMPGGYRRPGNDRTSSVNSIVSIPSVAERRSQIIVLFEEVGRR